MEKRSVIRLPINLHLRFLCCNTFHSGYVTNLSANGMYINSEICFPMKSSFRVFIQFKDGILKIPVQIVRTVKSGNIYEGMGVKLLNLPAKYLDLILNLNLASKS